jgi:NAD(P)-dependent dehydrogenase (short-subunit alcohol dehydrogenase family)
VYPELKGKVAAVTGAGLNIGRAVSLALARSGAHVAAIDIDPQKAEGTAQQARSEGLVCQPFVADAGDSGQTQAVVSRVIGEMGPIGIWVNNAGISTGARTLLADMEEDVFDRLIRVNLKGVWLGMKFIIPHMVSNGSGCIVNMSSVMGLVAQEGSSHYCASKHGVLGLTKVAALEYGPKGVRVNAVCPSRMEVGMQSNRLPPSPEERLAGHRLMNPASGRASRADEVAATVLFLCSDGAANMHGAAIVVDGGYTAK